MEAFYQLTPNSFHMLCEEIVDYIAINGSDETMFDRYSTFSYNGINYLKLTTRFDEHYVLSQNGIDEYSDFKTKRGIRKVNKQVVNAITLFPPDMDTEKTLVEISEFMRLQVLYVLEHLS
jgi:hypothetical protein